MVNGCNSVVTVGFQSIPTSIFYANTLKPLLVLVETGAEEKTRTSTHLRVHEPESCASTNSATSAYYFQMVTELSLSLLTLAKFFNDMCS